MQRRVSNKVYTATLKPETIPGPIRAPFSGIRHVQKMHDIYNILCSPRERDRSKKRLCLLLCTLFHCTQRPLRNPPSLDGDKKGICGQRRPSLKRDRSLWARENSAEFAEAWSWHGQGKRKF